MKNHNRSGMRFIAPEGFFTVADVAHILGISRQRVHQLLESRCVQTSGSRIRLIARSDLVTLNRKLKPWASKRPK